MTKEELEKYDHHQISCVMCGANTRLVPFCEVRSIKEGDAKNRARQIWRDETGDAVECVVPSCSFWMYFEPEVLAAARLEHGMASPLRTP